MKNFEQKRCLCKIVLGMAFLVFLSNPSLSQDAKITVRTESRWHRNKVDNAHMNKRIADAAEQYKEYAPIPRIAFYDIGFPKDKAEFAELNGYGLLLISSLSQNETELPLKRAYAVVDGKEIELKSIREVLIRNNDLTGQVVKTFGEYRADTLFLFPVYLRFQLGEILLDFAQTRTGLKIVSFDGTAPDALKGIPSTKPDEKKAIEEPMKLFMKREYPGYFEN